MTSSRERVAQIRAELFADHRVSDRPTMSWHLNRTHPTGGYDSRYAYSVTWTPGSLFIAGDLGEFTVTHYHAMPTIEATLRWLNGIGFHYLMGKSNAREEFDRDATVQFIIDAANEAAVQAGIAAIKGAREYRAAKVEALCEWDADETRWAVDLAAELAHGSVGLLDDRPRLADYLPDPGGFDRWGCDGFIPPSLNHDWIVPDGFEIWHCIFQHPDILADSRGLGPNCLLHAWARREVKESLKDLFTEYGQDRAVEFCQKIGLDDYYGSMSYPEQCYWFAAAIQHWVDQVIDQHVPATTEVVAS